MNHWAGQTVDFKLSRVHDTRNPKRPSRRNIKMTNLEKLQQAGLTDEDYKFNKNEKDAIESLTPAEVNALIRGKEKLGEAFIKKHVPHGMMF